MNSNEQTRKVEAEDLSARSRHGTGRSQNPGRGLSARPISKGERPNETLDKINQEYKLSLGLHSDLRSLEANT